MYSDECFEIGDIHFNKYFIYRSILDDKKSLLELETMFQEYCHDPIFVVKLGVDDEGDIDMLYLDKRIYTYKAHNRICIKRKKIYTDFNYTLLL
jgi:hypothetical protein